MDSMPASDTQTEESPRMSRGDAVIHALLSFPFFLVDRMGTWIGLAIVGYIAIYLPVKELSGHDTKLLAEVIVDAAVNKWIYFLALLIMGGGNILQYASHRPYVKRHGQREKELEKRLDPQRTSSGLSPSGGPPTASENTNGN